MEWLTRNMALQRVLSALSESNVVYKLTAAAGIAFLLHKSFYKPKNYDVFPVWAPIEIAIACYVLGGDGTGRRIFSSLRRYGGSLFGLTRAHQVLADLPGLDRFMSQSSQTLNPEPAQYTIFFRVFGGAHSPGTREKYEKSSKPLLEPVERLFLNDVAATKTLGRANIPEHASSFVTFSSDPTYMKRWERSADIRVTTAPRKPAAVEANLQSLVRDFGACITIPLLYGKDFLDRCPEVLDDFWKFDNDLFPLMMIGVPSWAPFKMVREGLAARSRITRRMEDLGRRIDQHRHGKPVDFGADMSDVSNAALGRSKVFERDGWAIADRGTADLMILWAQNANTQPVLFWLLAYIYSTGGLVARLREEVAPHVHLSQTSPPEIISIDIPSLVRHCQLLKACTFETHRLAVEPASIRYVAHHITVPDGDLKHELKPGAFLSVPYSMTSRDPSVYADPGKFVPERFLVSGPEPGKPVARYGKLRPWGMGAAMCKGRTFAEKELMLLAAAIISLWDIGPADGIWQLPAMIPGTGVKKPVKDIRVVITRRTLEVPSYTTSSDK